MKKIVSLTFVSAFFLFTMVVTSVVAQQRIVGVAVGDWFKYGDITFEWSSNDPNAVVPSGYEGWNRTKWMKMSITNVTRTGILVEMVVSLTNGTEEISDGWIDIDSGEGENAKLWIIAADLTVNDEVYSTVYSNLKINETVVRRYPDRDRTTNHVNIISKYLWNEQYIRQIYDYYWERETGVLVERSFFWENRTGDYLTTLLVWIRITESNVQGRPARSEFPSWILILLILIVSAVAIVIYKRRLIRAHKRKHRKRRIIRKMPPCVWGSNTRVQPFIAQLSTFKPAWS